MSAMGRQGSWRAQRRVELDGDVTRILARIRLLATDEGGRRSPILGGTSYRPNHNFFGPSNLDMAVGLIELPKDVILQPGGTIDIEVAFLTWPRLAAELYPGREWLIQEGAWRASIRPGGRNSNSAGSGWRPPRSSPWPRSRTWAPRAQRSRGG
jgi:elongation factor Tu